MHSETNSSEQIQIAELQRELRKLVATVVKLEKRISHAERLITELDSAR